MFYQFCHLVYPFAPAYFHKLSTLLRVHPPLWLVLKKVYYILRVLRLMIQPLCLSYVLAHLQTFLPIGHIQPVQVLQFRQPHPAFGHLLQRRRKMDEGFLRLSVSPGGFIPDAANTSGNLYRMLTLLETIMCIVSFYIGNNYRDLTAASLCDRLLQTHLLHRSPPRPLEQRSMQPV